jgi:hypothetical protein
MPCKVRISLPTSALSFCPLCAIRRLIPGLFLRLGQTFDRRIKKPKFGFPLRLAGSDGHKGGHYRLAEAELGQGFRDFAKPLVEVCVVRVAGCETVLPIDVAAIAGGYRRSTMTKLSSNTLSASSNLP